MRADLQDRQKGCVPFLETALEATCPRLIIVLMPWLQFRHMRQTWKGRALAGLLKWLRWVKNLYVDVVLLLANWACSRRLGYLAE
jgi:hypothetical protein